MARLLTTGLEVGRVAAEGNANLNAYGSPTYSTTNPRSGQRCLLCAAGVGEGLEYLISSSLNRDYWCRIAIRWENTPTSQGVIIGADLFGSPWLVTLETNDKLTLRNSLNAQVGSQFQGAAATWYVVEVHWRVNSSGTGTLEMRVNGGSTTGGTGQNIGNTAVGGLYLGDTIPCGRNVRLDDVAVNDDQGATSQTSWCDNRNKIALLSAVSDSSRTGWTGGGASPSTTNLWDAVDAEPPAGVAVASATNTSQIKDANSNTTDTYEANFAAYTDSVASGGAGMSPADVVVVYRMLARFANSNTTSKTLACKGNSNPNTTEGSIPTGTTAAAVDPTGWTTTFSQSVDPTIGQGNSVGPTAQVKNGTGTGSATCDFMGIYVEFTPYLDLQSSGAVAAPTLALTAKTTITLGSSPAVATPTLALTAKTTIALGTSPATASPTLSLTAQTQIPLGTSAASASPTLALTAATQVALGTSAASATPTLSLTATTQIPLGTSDASATPTLALSAATYVTLGTSPAQSAATASVTIAGAVVHLQTLASTTDGTSYTTGSFTPVANSLLVVFVYGSATVATGSVTDSQSLGFTEITHLNNGASRIYAFVANKLAAASSMTVTFDCTGDTATGAIVFVAGVSGVTRASTAAIRNSELQASLSGTAPTISISPVALTANPTLAAVANQADNPMAITPPTGFTELADTGISTPTAGAEYCAKDNGFTSSTLTWGSNTTSGNSCQLFVEVDTSGMTVPLGTSAASATPTLALTATTQIPLASSAASSSATLSVTAPALLSLSSAAAVATPTMGMVVLANVPPGGAIAQGNAPVVSTEHERGSSVFQGNEPDIQVPVTRGGATAQGTEPDELISFFELVGRGGATALGVSPSEAFAPRPDLATHLRLTVHPTSLEIASRTTTLVLAKRETGMRFADDSGELEIDKRTTELAIHGRRTTLVLDT